MNKRLYSVRPINDLKDMLAQSVSLFGNRTAYKIKTENGDYQEITYSAFNKDITAFGTSLLDLELQGKSIAIFGENRYEWCVAYLSIVNGVGTAVPIDKELTASEIQNLLEQSKVSAVVFTGKYLDAVEEMRPQIPFVKHWICMDDVSEESEIHSFSNLMSHGQKMVDEGNQEFEKIEINPDSPLILLFTSGTMGFAKGVMLSHKNICAVITGVCATVNVRPEDRLLSILPLHHTYECTLGFLTIIYSGASISFSDGLRYISRNLNEYKPTILVTVPLLLENVYNKVWKKANKQKSMKRSLIVGQVISGFLYKVLGIDIRRKLFAQIHDNVGGELRMFITGAAAIDPEVSKGFHKWGFSVLQGYGLTECAPLVTGNRDFIYRDKSAGLAIPGVEVKINSPDKKGIGEILIKGLNVMQGYFNDPEETERVLVDGWFYSGDVGRIDRKGFLYITGRCKNVIVTKNGKNIFPEELESYIKDSPYVGECIVYGELDKTSGETHIIAQIFPDIEVIREKLKNINLNIDTEEIRNLIQDVIKNVNRKIPLYKHIRQVTIRNKEFEKTTTRKIKRHTQIPMHMKNNTVY